jgi:hypothetical protein
MPRRDQGNPLLQLTPQPGRPLEFREDGTITGQVRYKCDASVALALRPRVGSPHPDFSGARCHKSVVTRMENGIAEIVSDYLGIESDPTPPRIEFVGGTGEEPIDTHEKFVTKLGGKKGAPLNLAQFDPETGEFIGFPPEAPNDLGGVRGYLVPSCTVRVTFFTSNAQWGLYSLGEIARPPGNIPKPPGSRNWLKVNWARRDFGLIYQITEEYLASGKRGWNRLIYG